MKNSLFKESDTYKDIESKLQDNLITLYENCDDILVEEGIKAFSSYEDKDRIVSFFKKVDHLYKRQKRYQIMLYGMIVLYYHNDFASSLSDDALALFCHNNHFFTNDLFGMLEQSVSYVLPKTLEAICKKTKNVFQRSEYYSMAEDMFLEELEVHDEETKKDICDKMDKMTNSDYKVYYKKYLSYTVMDKVGKNINIAI